MNYWFCVGALPEDIKGSDLGLWWCLPYWASAGDGCLFYVPRSISRDHGVKFQSVVKKRTRECTTYQSLCSGCVGISFSGKAPLLLTELETAAIPTRIISARLIKSLPAMSSSLVLKYNFQGTCFQITAGEFKAVSGLF